MNTATADTNCITAALASLTSLDTDTSGTAVGWRLVLLGPGMLRKADVR